MIVGGRDELLLVRRNEKDDVMANAIVVGVIVLAAFFAVRRQFRKGQWTKSCVGCAGHCSSCGCKK